jgi:hypothetical protein
MLRTGDPTTEAELVVDEINRVDLPRIFGELITVLEHDKRVVEVILPLTGDTLCDSAECLLIGTRNSVKPRMAAQHTDAMRIHYTKSPCDTYTGLIHHPPSRQDYPRRCFAMLST